MENGFLRAAFEVVRTVFAFVLFSLFALALVAVAVRAYAPPQAVVTAINWAVKCVGVFVCCMLFSGTERALFKGMAAGALSSLCTMLVFALIGGGFALDAFFLLELLVCTLLGGAGALLGAKFRKR